MLGICCDYLYGIYFDFRLLISKCYLEAKFSVRVYSRFRCLQIAMYGITLRFWKFITLFSFLP